MNEYAFIGVLPICTINGIKIATNYNRIVHGGRGAYVEFLDSQIVKEGLTIPEKQRWRMTPYSQNPAFYEWWETEDGVKLYHQLKTVDYADYIVGRWYVTPTKLQGFKVVGRYDYNKP